MPKKLPVRWTPIKKSLKEFNHDGLITVIKDLYDLSPQNRIFLTARFTTLSDEEVLETYKERIVAKIDPDRIPPIHPDLKGARAIISEYKKATSNSVGTLELMLTYVETGTEFTLAFGDLWESFYDSMLSVLDEFSKLLIKECKDNYPQFEQRLDQLQSKTRSLGWGYGDGICYTVTELQVWWENQKG